MSTRYPELMDERAIPDTALNDGVGFLGADERTYLEVEPNYVTLHFALDISQATSELRLLHGDSIGPEHRPTFHARDVAQVPGGTVNVVWRPDGVLAMEEPASPADSDWVTGQVRAKRRPA